MKQSILLALISLMALGVHSQEFEWANNYEINANEVAGFTIDESGNTFSVGVYGAPISLPYHGEGYLMKTSPDGTMAWSSTFGGDVFFGDITAVGNQVCVVGQSYSDVIYNGQTLFTDDFSYMFILLINENGTLDWSQQFTNRHAQYANIDYHQGVIALQARGQYNSGNHMMYFNEGGNLIQERNFDDITIVDLSYHDGKTYISGRAGFDAFFIDDVLIPAPAIESSTFIIALDDDLTAMWAHASSAISNHDGRVEANGAGIFSYQTIVTPSFDFTSEVWHLDFDGTLLNSINPPVFTNNVSLYPDMMVDDCHVALFAQNDFDFESHKLIIMDHDLNVVNEKTIDGVSYLYSGQISSYQHDIYVAHIHSSTLSFDDDVTLSAFDPGVQVPYIAKFINGPQDCLVAVNDHHSKDFIIYPNPASQSITIENEINNFDWLILSVDGKLIMSGSSNEGSQVKIDLPSSIAQGTYFISLSSGVQVTHRKLIIE